MCGQHHAPAAFTSRKDPVPIVQEVGWVMVKVLIYIPNVAGSDSLSFASK